LAFVSRKDRRETAGLFVGDLRVPPGNRLELLKGNLAGFHSILINDINDQWRIIFQWITDSGPANVRIVDYH
jgi:proteic killer suppression protein